MPSTALLRYVYAWHKSKLIVHGSKLLVYIATACAMAAPTTSRLVTYSIMSAVYVLLHMIISMVVVNSICVGSFIDFDGTLCCTSSLQDDGFNHNCDRQNSQNSSSLRRRRGSIGPLKTVLCIAQNLFDTCISPSGGKRSSSIGTIYPLIRHNFSALEGEELMKNEGLAHRVIYTAKFVRVVLCTVFIAWSQFYLGPCAPTWLWGLVRSGLGTVESESEPGARGQKTRHILIIVMQCVTLVVMLQAGSSWSMITTSIVCVLPSYVLSERLNEYTNERISATQIMREYAREAKFKARLLAQISHELRSPLMSIIAVTEMAMSTECSEEVRKENGSIVLSCSTELLSMINDILDFGKLEGKKAMLDTRPIDLRKMIAEMRVMMSSVLRGASRKGLQFHMNLRDRVPVCIESDEPKLHQICRNLIGNAIKFTDEGEVTVELSVLSPGELVEQYIQDRPKYDVCYMPKTADELLAHDLGIYRDPTRIKGLSPVELRSRLVRNAQGSILPNLSDTARNRLKVIQGALGQQDDRKLLVLSVEDTGIGIEESHIRRLFMPFSQADSSITRTYGGTGLGLSIVRELVSLMSGFVLAFSTHGHGSKFTVVVPVTVSDPTVVSEPSLDVVKAEDIQTEKGVTVSDIGAYNRASSKVGNEGDSGSDVLQKCLQSVKSPEKTPSKDLKCLIVDDQLLNRKIFGRLLTKLGFAEHLIEYAKDGEEACDLFKQRHQEGDFFELCLLDMMMPRMDGFTALRTIRQFEQEHGIQKPCVIIMVSANVIEIEKCMSHGADSYLAKPFTTAMLQQKLDELLARDAVRQNPIVLENTVPT